MKRVLAAICALFVAGGAFADDKDRLVQEYVGKIVANSLDQPEGHQVYFGEIALLNNFSADFVAAYASALSKTRARGLPSLFEHDPMTGDMNRCPIGSTVISDKTRPDTRIMIEALLERPACDGQAPDRLRLMFFMVPDAVQSQRLVIDDILRQTGEDAWTSLKAELERL